MPTPDHLPNPGHKVPTAPNGKPSNLSPELHAYVRSDEFKQWFGDWQSDPGRSSQVLDENGEPLVLYRGQMSHADTPFVNHGDGIHFTPDREAAIGYGADADPIPVFLNARNPYKVDFDGDADTEGNALHADIRGEYHHAKKEGFDILIATNTFDGKNALDQYVVHSDSQVRRIDTLKREHVVANTPHNNQDKNIISSPSPIANNALSTGEGRGEAFTEDGQREFSSPIANHPPSTEDGRGEAFNEVSRGEAFSSPIANHPLSTEDGQREISSPIATEKSTQTSKSQHPEEEEISSPIATDKSAHTQHPSPQATVEPSQAVSSPTANHPLSTKEGQGEAFSSPTANHPLSTKEGQGEAFPTRFQFIGEVGAWQLDNAARSLDILLALATAKEMTEAGKDALSVKMATGWERGADKKWRYELPDIRMPEYSLSLLRDGHADGRAVTLGEVMPQAPFLKAYPDMASMPVITDKERLKGAAYNPEKRLITISENELHIFDTEDLNAMNVSETLLHEIQHAIQHIEGFATDGNILTVASHQRREAERAMAELHDIYEAYEAIGSRTLSDDPHEALMAYEERDRYESQYEQQLKAYVFARQKMEEAEMDLAAGRLSQKNYQDYRSMAGEVEARNTAARAEMTPEERRRTLAAATEDVARESQRVILRDASCLIREPQTALLHNDIALRDKLVALMLNAGIRVNTNWREGQAVLDAARSGIRLQNATEETGQNTKGRQARYRSSGPAAAGPDNETVNSNLSETQQEQVRSDAFKRWFGDWQEDPETASKLLDENGEPMVLYHGTNVAFNTFEPHEGLRWYSWGEQFSVNAKGFFFSDNHDDAYKHANSNAFMKGGERIVMPVYVSMRTPADLSKNDDAETEQLFHDLTGYWPLEHPDYHCQDQWWRIVEDEEFDIPAKLSEKGYDGIVFAEKIDRTSKVTTERSYYVTNPNQIKSASLNNGGFSPDSNDIRFQLANASPLPLPTQRPVFISNALLALYRTHQQKATPRQWLGMLNNLNGIKPGEDKWTGLSQWLRDSNEKSLTKQQVLDFIAQNQIRIEETHYERPEDSTRFAELRKEFTKERNRVEDLYEEADRKYGEFLDRMSEKHGPGLDIEHDLTKEEREEEDRLLSLRDSYDTTGKDDTPESIAFEVMSRKYGSVFAYGFDYDEEGLEVSDSNYAASFLGVWPIHDRRLDFITPNLHNKKEIALTVPTIEGWEEDDELHFGDADDGRAVAWVRFGDTLMARKANEEEVRRRIDRMPKPEEWEKVDGSYFVNRHDVYFLPGTRHMAGHTYIYDDARGHFSIEGPMARQMQATQFDSLHEAVDAFNRQWVTARNSPTTERVLVIDEIQSKRHQEGHKKGYMETPAAKAWNDYRAALSKKHPEGWSVDNTEAREKGYHILTKEEARIQDELLAKRNSEARETERLQLVPEAPFEHSWHELAMKRMLRYAAENGYDRVAWTTGEQQAKRYDIGKVINEIVVGEKRTADELNHYFGEKSIKQDGKVVMLMVKDSSKSLGLAVDDEGKVIYCHETEEMDNKRLDQLLGKRLADEVMKADCQTITTDDIQVGTEGITTFYDKMLPQFVNRYAKKWNAKAEDVQIPNLGGRGEKTTLHSVAVTPQMKADVMQGQPMFFLTPQGDAYGFTHDSTIYIDPRIATSETPIHEYAHLWAQAMQQHNPEEWQNIIRLMKQVSPAWEMVRTQYTHLSSDSDIAEEVLAQYSGRKGMEQLRRAIKSHRPELDDVQSQDILDRIKAAIDRFWQKTADFLHVHYHSADEVADRVMRDLLHQVNPQRLARQQAAQSTPTSKLQHPKEEEIPFPTATEKSTPTSKLQHPKEEEIPSPSATTPPSTEKGQREFSSPSATTPLSTGEGRGEAPILAYSAASYDEVRTLAHGIKEGDKEAIKEAARRMADVINAMPDKEKVVLVPMPSHEGHATYAKTLAEEIAGMTDTRTADCLLAAPHPPLYELKKTRGIEKLPAPLFRLEGPAATKSLFQDRIPVIIDNVLDTGTSAVAAARAFGDKAGVRIAVLGHTDNFYLFDNHIELAAGGKKTDVSNKPGERYEARTGQVRTRKDEMGHDSSRPPYADNNAASDIDAAQQQKGLHFQLIGTKGAAEMDRHDGMNRLDNLMAAMTMEKQDRKPLEIKVATGWERGADGKWKHEIPDIQVNHNHFAVQWVETYNKYWNAVRNSSAENFRMATLPYTRRLDELYENFGKEHKLGDILSPDSPVLKAYPQIGNFRLKIYNSGNGGGGYYDTRTNTVQLNLHGRTDAKSIAGTLAHEIQHAIQEMEGFAYGAPLRKPSEAALLHQQLKRLEEELDTVGKEKTRLFTLLYAIPGWSQRTHIAYYKVTDENHKGFGDDIKKADPALSRQLIDDLKRSQPMRYRTGVELARQIEEKERRMERIMDEMVKTNQKMSSPDRDHTVSAGEVEARNVRRRMDMTPEKRKTTLAESTEDVARMFQHVSFDYLLSANEKQDNMDNTKKQDNMPTHDLHRDYLQDFLDSKPKMQAAKAEQNLNKLVRFELPDRTNRVMTNAEFIQYALEKQLDVRATPEKGNIAASKVEEIERAFSGFNETIVRRKLDSYYKDTPEMKAFEELLNKMLHARDEEKPSSQEYHEAREAAINSIIDANTPTKTFYHVQYDNHGASMPISKTMYDYAAFIQANAIENLKKQLTDILTEPRFDEWLRKHEEGVVFGSEGDLFRMKDGQLQMGWHHMPEGASTPEFIVNDLANRSFNQQKSTLGEAMENAIDKRRTMTVGTLLEQLKTDSIRLETPMTVRLGKEKTDTIAAVGQDKPQYGPYLISEGGMPYIFGYVNYDDFNKAVDKAIEDGTQQLLEKQNRERMEPQLAQMREELKSLMEEERLMHFIAPFPEIRMSVNKDGEIYLKNGELRINDFDHNGKQYDIPLAEERPHVQLVALQEALQTAHVFLARMQLLDNMEAAEVNVATMGPGPDLSVRLRGWEETGDTRQVSALQVEGRHFKVTDADGNSFPSYDIIEEDETLLLNRVNDMLKEEMGIGHDRVQMAHEALGKVMRDYGIDKMELPGGESIELKGGRLTLHGHDGNGTPADLSYDELPHDRQADIFNHVAENIQKMEEDLAGEELKLAAMMADMQTDWLHTDDSVATLYHIPDPKERQDIIVNAIRMDDKGDLKVITEEEKEYPIESLHLPDRATVVGNAVRMASELRQKEEEQAAKPDESQKLTYPQYLQQLMQVAKVQTIALYEGKVIDNKEGELVFSDLTRTAPFKDLPEEERNTLAWSGTELLVSHLESELERLIRNTDAKQVSLPNGDVAELDDNRPYNRLRLALHDPEGNAQDYKDMDKLKKVEVLTAFAEIAAQEARDLFAAHAANREDGRLHIAPDNWIDRLPDTHLAIVRTDENGEPKTLSLESVNGFTQLNVVNFAIEQQEVLDRQQGTEKAAEQKALSQQPEGEEIPSPLATGQTADQRDGDLQSPTAADQNDQAQQAEGEAIPSPIATLTRLMQEHHTDSVMLPWGDQIRLDENGTLMMHGHNEDATPKVFPFSELSETQQEVFARHAAESLAKNAEQQSQDIPSPSATDQKDEQTAQSAHSQQAESEAIPSPSATKEPLSTEEGQKETPSPSATDQNPDQTAQSQQVEGEAIPSPSATKEPLSTEEGQRETPSPSATKEPLSTEEGQKEIPSPSATKDPLPTGEERSEAPTEDKQDVPSSLSQEADRLRERVAALMTENEIINVSFEPTTVHPLATWPNDICADKTQTMDGIHRDESGWLQTTDGNVVLSSVSEYLPQEQIGVLRKAEAAILQSLEQQLGGGNAVQLDQAKIENFLGAEMLPRERDAFLEKIRHNDNLMSAVEEKMNLRVQPNVLVKYAVSEQHAQEHRAMAMMKMLELSSIPSWGDSSITVRDNQLVWQRNDGSKTQNVLDMPTDTARARLLIANNDLTHLMEEKVKGLLKMEEDKVVFVNDLPVKVRTCDNDYNFYDTIVVPEKVGFYNDDNGLMYVQDTEGNRHLLNMLNEESKTLLLNDIVRSSRDRSEEIEAYLTRQMPENQRAAFEKEMESNPELKDEVFLTATIIQGIREKGKEEDKATIERMRQGILEAETNYNDAMAAAREHIEKAFPESIVSLSDPTSHDDPLADIKTQLRDSGLILMPVKFDYDDRRYMDTNGWVNTPFLDFSTQGSHRPETVIAPVSVEYQRASDTLLLHGKNANGDLLTIPLESPTRGNKHAYTVLREQLEQPLQKAIQHARTAEYLADDALKNDRPSDAFIHNMRSSVLQAQNGNFIHVGDYDKTNGLLHVTEKNETGHEVNETWIDPMRIASMVARKEAVAADKGDNKAEASLSYPTLEEVTQKRTAQEQSEVAKVKEKYLYTVFESRDPNWEEKAVIINADIDETPWGKEVQLTSESNQGQMVFCPKIPDGRFVQTGNKIDGIITDISRLGFTDRGKDLPHNLMDPVSYCRVDERDTGGGQARRDGLMVDFGPNHFYFQQTLSGPGEGRYRASYEIEDLNHGTREKVVDADIDMVYERMRRFLSNYDLRENQSHSAQETESLVKDIANHALDQMVTLTSRIYNIPTGDKEMADDPEHPVIDVSMVEVNREGEIILHGNGGPAPLDSLDETARFEVLRRTVNDMMDQNLDLGVKRERLTQLSDNNRLIDIVKPFEYAKTLLGKNGDKLSVGALVIDDLKNVTLFQNVAEAYEFTTRKDADKNKRTLQTDLNDLSPASQRKVLDGALRFYGSRDMQQRALKEAEDYVERTTRRFPFFSNNMSNPNSEEKIMKPEEQKQQVEQPRTDQQQQEKEQRKAPAREQATEQIRTAIGPDQKVRLNEDERVTLETNKGATINVQSVSITKNETVSLYGETEGSKKSISASQLTDDALAKLAGHLESLRSARQAVAAETPAEQKAQQTQDQQHKGEAIPSPDAAGQKAQQSAQQAPQQATVEPSQNTPSTAATEQKAAQKAETAPQQGDNDQKAEQAKERKVEPIEIKPDSKVEYNITKNPALDRVYDIQLFVDGEKKAGHHLSIEDRKDFFDKKVTGQELVPKYFEKELAGQKLPDNIDRYHAEKKQEAQEQKPAQEQNAEQTKERKADPIEIKPDSKVQVNVVPNKALDHVYDIQLYVDGQKQGRGHHLSIEDRKAFFEQKTPEEKTAFAASLLPKYFEKELAGQKLPDNIDRYRAEKKQEAQEQKPAQAAEQKPAQTAGANPVEVWKNARDNDNQERTTFVQRDGQYGRFYQTYGTDATKVAQLMDKPAKEIKDGPNAQLAFINVKQADMPDLMRTMKELDIPYKVVGMDGKYARVLQDQQNKTQAAGLSGYKMPEGKQASDVKVWLYQGKPFMNGVVDGVKLEPKEISKEDWTAFKGQKATPEQMVGKYYAPAEMENKQAQKHTKAMAR